jgi:hypothetical protein
MSNYFILHESNEDPYCVADADNEMVDDFMVQLRKGERIGKIVLSEITYKMDPDFNGIKVSDFINSGFPWFMVTQKAKKVIEDHATVDIEFIPFTLLNHKGRVAANDCYMVNVIGRVTCVDREKTEGSDSFFQDNEYDEIDKLYLLEDQIPADKNLFRLEEKPNILIVRRDLKEIFEREGLTGVEYLNMGDEVRLV